MRSIAIILGDNDFGNLFRGLLESLINIIIYYDGTDFTEENVRTIIKEGVRFHYIAYQTRWDMMNKYSEMIRSEEEIGSTVNYILNNLRILFDNQADTAFANEDHDGGAWYLDIRTGKIISF